MSSISTISNTFLRITIPYCSYKFPIITKSIAFNNICDKNVITIQSQQPLQPINYGHACTHNSHVINLQAFQAGRVDPPEHVHAGSPQEFPSVDPPGDSPEVQQLLTSPEIVYGGGTPPPEVNPPPNGLEPTPEIEFPTPPVGPPPGPDVPPMPPGPDITPPGPEVDPPRPPLPEVPPLRPPGPEIVPPPNFPPDIKPPPGSPFGDFGF